MSQFSGSILPGGCTKPTRDLTGEPDAELWASALARLGQPVRTERFRLPDGKEVEVRFYARRRLFDGIRRLLGRRPDTADKPQPLIITRGRLIGGQEIYQWLTNNQRVTRI
jgi:hypothetical protein